MPRFSIVMPCYNAERFLIDAIDSIRRQSESDWELVCVDDGSTDFTLAMLEAAAAEDARISVIKQSNAGPGVARNRGVSQAQGQILAFLDADDVWAPEKLHRLGQVFSASEPPDLVFARVAFFRENPAVPSTYSSVPPGCLGVRNFIGENPACTMSNIAITAAAFRLAGGFEPGVSHSEDLAWLIRMAGAGLRIEGIGETLTFYRANERGLSADLEAMHRGWKLAIAQAAELDPSISPAELRAGEAIHLRYLARRALRTGAPARTSLALIGRALVKSPHAYFNHPRRSLSILAGALAALMMPVRIRRHTFGN